MNGPLPGGQSALSGRVLDTTDFVRGTETPVVGAVVSVLGATARATTDATGRFMLSGIPAGVQVFDINVANAQPAPDGSLYAAFREDYHKPSYRERAIDRGVSFSLRKR